jgi:drug/metabolite transporter (DMT)-like permease
MVTQGAGLSFKSRPRHRWHEGARHPGVLAAIGAAALFGMGTPLSKPLLAATSPWFLAGLLYLGSGLGLTLYRFAVRAPAVRLARNETLWLTAAIFSGGVVGPVLLMLGLSRMPASDVSLLLNAEGVFTALLAWFAFKENFDRRIALGMLSILLGVSVLSWRADANFSNLWPSLAVLGACLAWGIDNNLTRKVSLTDAAWIASVKGLAAGLVNLGLAFALGAKLPAWPTVAGAMALGFLAYGVSLALFVVGLRHLGTARAAAYFAVAPFVGGVLALALGEPFTHQLGVAAVFMAFGVWLHLTERHSHAHDHLPMEHDHDHRHDEHHQHQHDQHDKVSQAGHATHRHPHRHEPLRHSHAHFPDAHHPHDH